jgi:hypothetical protein
MVVRVVPAHDCRKLNAGGECFIVVGIPGSSSVVGIPTTFGDRGFSNTGRLYHKLENPNVSLLVGDQTLYLQQGSLKIFDFNQLAVSRVVYREMNVLDFLRFHGYVFVQLEKARNNMIQEVYDICRTCGSVLLDNCLYNTLSNIRAALYHCDIPREMVVIHRLSRERQARMVYSRRYALPSVVSRFLRTVHA